MGGAILQGLTREPARCEHHNYVSGSLLAGNSSEGKKVGLAEGRAMFSRPGSSRRPGQKPESWRLPQSRHFRGEIRALQLHREPLRERPHGLDRESPCPGLPIRSPMPLPGVTRGRHILGGLNCTSREEVQSKVRQISWSERSASPREPGLRRPAFTPGVPGSTVNSTLDHRTQSSRPIGLAITAFPEAQNVRDGATL